MNHEEIDYYGVTNDYIHLKFGRATKAYNFTADFREEYPNFVEKYEKYWNNEEGGFETSYYVIEAIERDQIPVHLYFNYTDEPCKTVEEAYRYLARENTQS